MEEKLNITIDAILNDGKLREVAKAVMVELTDQSLEKISRLIALKALWEEFGDIPVIEDENGEEVIDADFYHWPAGTDRYDIWHWFDEKCPNNLHDDLMFSGS